MARSGWSRLQTAVGRTMAIVAVAGVLSMVGAPPSYAGSGLSCHYTLIQWSGGFSADLRIYNHTDSTINGWTAFWTLPTATQVTNTWSGSITQDTPYDATARNAFYNGVIQPGASAALGWTAIAPATDVPAEIIVNGSHCPVS